MKDNHSLDPFKSALKSKLADQPVYKKTEEDLWEKVFEEIATDRKEPKISPFIWYAVAASLFIGIITLVLTLKATEEIPALSDTKKTAPINSEVNKPQTNETSTVAADKEHSTGIVEEIDNPPIEFAKVKATEGIEEHVLPDKSKITLNKGSLVSIKSDFEKSRIVEVTGEAYFEIEPDKSKPFTVNFSGNRLVVLGTRFNVRNVENENYQEVSVTEGIVKVFDKNGKDSVVLHAGDQLKISENKLPAVSKVDSYNTIFWKTGILNFKNSTMDEVAQLISRKYDLTCKVAPQIAKCTFTGDLSELSLEEAISVMELTTSFKAEKRNKEIIITGKNCE